MWQQVTQNNAKVEEKQTEFKEFKMDSFPQIGIYEFINLTVFQT